MSLRIVLKYKLTLFGVLLFFSINASSQDEIDSLGKKELKELSEIVLGNINIPDSSLKKPGIEFIFFELHFKNGKLKDVKVWCNGNGILCIAGTEVASIIKQRWKPSYTFPSFVLYPLKVCFFKQGVILPEDDNLVDELVRNFKHTTSKNLLVLSPSLINRFMDKRPID